MKQIKAILLSLLIIMNLITSVSAVDWFEESHQSFVPSSIYPSFYSPFRTTPAVSIWSNITSTHNEPRDGAGATHYAIDVYGYRGSAVYPIANGYVDEVGGSGATRYVIIRHPLPINQGGGTIYVRYMHLTEIPVFTDDEYIYYNESIGKTINFTYPDHVDMVLYRWTNENLTGRAGFGVSRTWMDYYGDISTWSYGVDLEYIKNVTFTKVGSQYKVSAKIYTFQSGVKVYPGTISMYVKYNGTWTEYAMSGAGENNECTLPSTLTGKVIEYYIVARRTGDGWSLFPSYYYNPPSNNSSNYNATNPQYTFAKYLS